MVNTSDYRLLCKGRKNLSFIILLSKTCTSLYLGRGILWINNSADPLGNQGYKL